MPRMLTARQPSSRTMARAPSITMAASSSLEWSERRAIDSLQKYILNCVQYSATYLNTVQLCPWETAMSSPVTLHSGLKFLPPGAFAREVNQRARAVMQHTTRFGDAGQWGRTAAFLGMGLIAYGLLLSGTGNTMI